MAYPSLPQAEGTKGVPRSGVKIRQASNNAIRTRAIAGTTFYDPVVVHRGLTAAQRATFLAFYVANRATSFTFTYAADSTSVTCVFAEKPFDEVAMPVASGIVYNITVYLLQAA